MRGDITFVATILSPLWLVSAVLLVYGGDEAWSFAVPTLLAISAFLLGAVLLVTWHTERYVRQHRGDDRCWS